LGEVVVLDIDYDERLSGHGVSSMHGLEVDSVLALADVSRIGRTDNKQGKTDMGAERPPRGTGRTDVPGVQLAAVHGLNDLFAVANRIAAERQAAQLPVLRVSHWKADAEQTPQRVYDSHPGADSHLLGADSTVPRQLFCGQRFSAMVAMAT
jgi:hypothetical protein